MTEAGYGNLSLLRELTQRLRATSLLALAPLEELLSAGDAMTPADHALFLGTTYDDTLRLQRLSALLDDVIAAATTGLTPTFQSTQLASALRRYVDSIAPVAAARGLHLAFDADEEMEDVFVDRGMLARSFVALVANAFAHTSRGGAITVSVREEVGGVEVSISDTGPGIPEPLSVLHQDLRSAIERGRSQNRLGLGLWLTQRYLEAHGGAIEIESRPSTVTLTFLRGKSHLDPKKIDEEPGAPVEGLTPADLIELEGDRRIAADSAVPSRRTAPPAEGVVLVVAGTELVRESIAQLLRGRYSVYTTALESAVALAADVIPDVVVIDGPSSPGSVSLKEALARPLPTTQFLRIVDRPDPEDPNVLVRPFPNTLLLAEMRNLVRLKELAKGLHEQYGALEARSRRLSDELAQARDLQRSMLNAPDHPITGLKVEVVYRPVELVGGDLYDFSVLDDTLLRIFLCDTAGGGIAASLATMVIKAEYEAIKWTSIRAAPVLASLNERFTKKYGHLKVRFSAMLLSIDLGEGIARYSLAASPPPLKLTGNTVVHLDGDPSSVAIGVTPTAQFVDHKIPFLPNDSLYAFTDGLVDERSSSGEPFGVRGLAAAILQARSDGVSEASTVTRWLEEFSGRKLADDATFIGLKRY